VRKAYLKAGENQPEQLFGTAEPRENHALSINRDGPVIAVGASRQDVAGKADAGAVYIYERSSTTGRTTPRRMRARCICTEDAPY
jgi:hypothetical protein